MDSLPAELLVSILRYLPREDLTRFKGLSKRFPDILEKNKRLIPNQKPMVSIRIYTKMHHLVSPENMFMEISHMSKFCELELEEEIKLVKGSLKLPSIALLTQSEGRKNLNLFFAWIFSKADVELLKIDTHSEFFDTDDENMISINAALIEVLQNADVRISDVRVYYNYLNKDSNFVLLSSLSRVSPNLHLHNCCIKASDDALFKELNAGFDQIVFHAEGCNIGLIRDYCCQLFRADAISDKFRIEVTNFVDHSHFDYEWVFDYEREIWDLMYEHWFHPANVEEMELIVHRKLDEKKLRMKVKERMEIEEFAVINITVEG